MRTILHDITCKQTAVIRNNWVILDVFCCFLFFRLLFFFSYVRTHYKEGSSFIRCNRPSQFTSWTVLWNDPNVNILCWRRTKSRPKNFPHSLRWIQLCMWSFTLLNSSLAGYFGALAHLQMCDFSCIVPVANRLVHQWAIIHYNTWFTDTWYVSASWV